MYFHSSFFFFYRGGCSCFPANLKITVWNSAGSQLAEENEAQTEKQPDKASVAFLSSVVWNAYVGQQS